MGCFKRLNLNPWGRNAADCTVRALAAAVGMKYRAVCRVLGADCVEGRGADCDADFVTPGLIAEKFRPFFGEIKTAWDDLTVRLFKSNPRLWPDFGITIGEFCREYAGRGRFVLLALPPREERGPLSFFDSFHAVYADLCPGKGYFIDSWDSSRLAVAAYMRVTGILRTDDPRSMLYRPGKTKAP